MKNIYFFAVILLVMGLGGCLSTVHPIFKEKDLLYNPALIGTFKAEGESETLVISRATTKELEQLPGLRNVKDKTYMIRTVSGSGIVTDAYFGFLIKLGKNYYMDFFPAETEATTQYDDFYKGHFVRMHTTYRISLLANEALELKQLDEGFLKELIRNKKIRIRHEQRNGDEFVITAPTEELQQYLLKYGDVPEAYSKDETATYMKLK